MKRYWLNLKTLRYRFNDLELAPARKDAERWLHTTKDLGWFDSPQAMNRYIRDQVMPMLEAAWINCPELRLGQLIVNAAKGDHDPYYVPDGDLLEGLKRFAQWTI